MPSPNWPDPRSPAVHRPDGPIRIEHGIDRVVHLPPESTLEPALYEGTELSPASQGTVDWVEALYPARGVDAFMARELDLPIDAHLLTAPTFNQVLDAAVEGLKAMQADRHPAGPLITAALDVLGSQALLRGLLDRYRNALLEA